MARRTRSGVPLYFIAVVGVVLVLAVFFMSGSSMIMPTGLDKGIRCPSGDYGQRDSGCPAGKVYCKDVGCIAGLTPEGCPADQFYCPGVGCVSGEDKCKPMSVGGPSAVFSKETFDMPSNTPIPTNCPDGSRTTNGKCLMDY
jgi:hypothetical protein